MERIINTTILEAVKLKYTKIKEVIYELIDFKLKNNKRDLWIIWSPERISS
jgi:hypothetical protein